MLHPTRTQVLLFRCEKLGRAELFRYIVILNPKECGGGLFCLRRKISAELQFTEASLMNPPTPKGGLSGKATAVGKPGLGGEGWVRGWVLGVTHSLGL